MRERITLDVHTAGDDDAVLAYTERYSIRHVVEIIVLRRKSQSYRVHNVAPCHYSIIIRARSAWLGCPTKKSSDRSPSAQKPCPE
ncbi:hypothetical protein MRB53_037341 [Persea americana]|nr:hypothetical protein MRB53_037341 [Persea americana]